MNKCFYLLNRANKGDKKSLESGDGKPLTSNYRTICINGGKKQKLRAGDILGTLCKELDVESSQIGKIDIKVTKSYIAIKKSLADRIVKALKSTKIKKRKFVAWILF